MNPNADPPPPLLSTPCDRHPQEHFTVFCPSCLCERLSFLQPSTSSSSRKPPIATTTTSTATLKSIFKPSGIRPEFFPDHRRTKSFSASINEGLPGDFEPQRKSWSLFSSSNVVQGPITNQENDDVEEAVEEEELKGMKDHIDLDTETKNKTSGNFWPAASVFSKKLHQWRQNQKLKKMKNIGGSVRLAMEKPSIGRRSCDIDPRLMSFDNSRYSFDEARTSCDGHLIGRTFQRIPTNTMVMDSNSINDEYVPGGSAQTRDYYSDSRSRKSLDRSNSIRKNTAAVVAEIDEMKSISTAKVSPAIVDCRDSISNSNSETFENGNGDCKGSSKKSRRWSKAWNFLGFINRKSVSKDEDEDGYNRGANGVKRSNSYSESQSEMRRVLNPMLSRSNSCLSWRGSSGFGGSYGGASRYGVVSNGRLSFDSIPMSGRGSGNGRNGLGKNRANHAHCIDRRFY